MRENKLARSSERLDSLLRRISGNRLSANNKQREYRSADYLHGNDRRSGIHANYLSREEFTYRVGITLASAGTFGVGLGQCIAKVFGW